MQAHSRFSVSGGSCSSSAVSADEHEAVIRALTRGHELTAQLQAEAMRALRGQGQAEGTAAFILQEVSRAFTVCLSIMSSPAARAPPPPPPPPPPEVPAELAGRRPARDENVPRREIVTYNPYSDGYQWRKYGQKKITNTRFPRCYYRCSNHRNRGCPATRQVQQRSHGDPPQYVVVYVNEHTCDTTAWEPEASVPAAATGTSVSATATNLPAGLLGGRGVQEEHERQALVSSLACVLGAHSPAGSSSSSVAAAFRRQEPQPPSVVVDPSGGGSGGGGGVPPRVHVDAALDVMDYDVAGALFFGDSNGLPADDDGLPF